MSENSTVSKELIMSLLEHLALERKLVCPVDIGKVIEYREASILNVREGFFAPNSTITINDRVTYNSLKSFYFPQTELMFTFDDEEVTDHSDMPGYVIFGARPCDLEALRVMSVVYSTGKYADPFFQRRFDANLLIGVGCKERKPECFCHELGIDKEFSDFCDIMLTDTGDDYLLEFLSDKGKESLKGFASLSNADCTNTRKVRAVDNKIISLDHDKEDSDYFDIIDWAKVTETCKGCGICTYVCPTCYCFDFKDVKEGGKAKRYKCWDSCMYPKFTLHASGHNPREHRYERYRQRVLHKYKYVPNNFDGAVACTGCGRCIRGCPVGMNIKEIVKQITGVQS